MRMRRGGLALAGVVVLATGPGAVSSAAAAATTWTVRPGGAVTATAGQTALADTTTGNSLTCASSTMSGTLKTGSGLPGAGIGSITKADYHCSQLLPWFLTPRGLPWHLNLVSFNAVAGVARGTISHLQLALSGPGCTALINGTSGPASDGVVAVTYAGQTGKLTILPAGGTLHWYHVSGCAGLVGSGDHGTLSAASALSPPQAITSP